MDNETTGPVTTWDARQARSGQAVERAGKWLEDQGVARETVHNTYRVEFRLADGLPVADLFTYAEDEQGRRHMNPETDAPAVNHPFTVTLGSLPPDDLRLI
jgi:hypothetical protein